jgi:mono/diheme cytochrome c family protein
LDVWVALLLIGLAVVAGGALLRRVPGGLLAFLGILVVFGFGIPALVIDDNSESTGGGEGAAAEGGGSGEQAAEGEQAAGGGSEQAGGGGGGEAAAAEGKQIFTQSCGTCHTLSDAGTSGNVGPNLDDLKPDEQRVANAIEKGGAGTGAMPANIVTGSEAEAVAAYVSSVAGK